MPKLIDEFNLLGQKLQDRQKALADQIRPFIQQFTDETGLRVLRIEPSNIETTAYSDPGPQYLVDNMAIFSDEGL